MIAAILRAQWLSMKVARGRVMGAVSGIIWYGIWLVMAVAGAVVLHPNGTLEGAHDPRANGGAAGV